MTGELKVQKALTRADRGDEAGAEEVFRSLLDSTPRGVLRARALVVLGDLMHPSDPEEARTLFAEALDLAERIDGADDLLDVELRMAREMLA